MNIKILDSWLREYLKTNATPEEIGEVLSLTSVSTERLDRFGSKDWVYDFEITTNRPDLMSIVGLAREAAAVLTQEGIKAEFISPELSSSIENIENPVDITIKNDPSLVKRVCAIVMEVKIGQSPAYIKERLESTDIRSLNNVIDVTNYVMREIGHPTHVFDYDRLTTRVLDVREAKNGEKVVTLDHKEYTLPGGDIVADDGSGKIVDLLGVMGTANSVVTNETKRILFFIDTVEQHHIRKTSMSTGIRTEAAILNEKGIDPELAYQALLRGIELYKEIADAKPLTNIIDIYPGKPDEKVVEVTEEKINEVIGIQIPLKTSIQILESLGFDVEKDGKRISGVVPSWRIQDVTIPEDLIEEIARVYGYHKIPTSLPPATKIDFYHMEKSEFYWERRIKEAFKYWGFIESFTYSMVSEDLLEGSPDESVKLKNPLTDDMVYMRRTLIPSLLQVIRENKNHDEVKIFEIANVYHKQKNNLPKEIVHLAGVLKGENVSYSNIKGYLDSLFKDLGIREVVYKESEEVATGADIYIKKECIGTIEVLEENIIDFEIDFEKLLQHVSLKKVYSPVSKFPPVIEDIRLEIDPGVSFQTVVEVITSQSELVRHVELLDVYQHKKTFRITYQSYERNLTNESITPVREKIMASLEKELKAHVA